MQTVSVEDAVTSFSELLAQVERGDTIFISRDGTLIAQLMQAPSVDHEESVMSRVKGLGFLAGKANFPDDIKTPFAEEIEEMFYGNPDKFKGDWASHGDELNEPTR